MLSPDFARQIERYGPDRYPPGRDGSAPSLHEAQAYCRRLARSHYENFTVASRLLPRELRQHLANIYAYCRWADDLADETGDPAESLALLDWWERLLRDLYCGAARHPVFVALVETVEEFAVPIQPFLDLVDAFRQDQTQTHYESFDELLEYCRRSANPVGRLVLHVGRAANDRNAELSDSICTGLQLANFWQDVARDYRRGRIYLPGEDMRRFGYDETMLAQGRCNEAFRRLLGFQVERAGSHIEAGAPLVDLAPRELRVGVELFLRGGLAVLRAIRRIDYDVLTRRPTVGKWEKLRLAAAAWWRSRTDAPLGGARGERVRKSS